MSKIPERNFDLAVGAAVCTEYATLDESSVSLLSDVQREHVAVADRSNASRSSLQASDRTQRQETLSRGLRNINP